MSEKKAAKDKAGPPEWLLEDYAKDGAYRTKRKPGRPRNHTDGPSLKAPKQPKNVPQVKVAKPGSKERFGAAMEASSDVAQPDQLITNAAPDIKAPTITVDADRGRVRKAWGAYRSASLGTAICAFARTGLPEETIIQMCGITQSQFNNWMDSDPDLARDYSVCRATWESAIVARISEIADQRGDWKAHAYLLERIVPQRWSANAAMPSTVTTPQEGSVPINLDPAHTVARLDELVMKAKAALVAQGHDPAAAQPISIDIAAEEEEK